MTDVPDKSHAVQMVEGAHGPELIWLERETPKPGPDEALVRVRAAGVSPSDVLNLAGGFGTKLPRVPGRDLAGTVIVGPEPWNGTDVWAVPAGGGIARDGSHAEYTVVRVEALSKKPASIGFEEAAGAGVPYVTAWEGLVNRARVQAGETGLPRPFIDASERGPSPALRRGGSSAPRRVEAFFTSDLGWCAHGAG